MVHENSIPLAWNAFIKGFGTYSSMGVVCSCQNEKLTDYAKST